MPHITIEIKLLIVKLNFGCVTQAVQHSVLHSTMSETEVRIEIIDNCQPMSCSALASVISIWIQRFFEANFGMNFKARVSA